MTRRRFLTITAATGIAAGSPVGAAPLARWRGIALGAGAQMQIMGLTDAEAAPILAGVTAELARLEDIFSLYRAGSALSILNREGTLEAPPAELLALCSLTSAIHAATDGAFDPTVQPLWQAAARGADDSELARARGLIGWQDVRYDSARIALPRPGMALTFNGIAQGYVTDRIADRLRSAGPRDVLVDFGEIRALGNGPGGAGWRAGIAAPGAACCTARITLSDRALATSATLGTTLDAAGQAGHVLDPRRGRPARNARLVSVSAATAAVADGLSTALCALDLRQWDAAIAAFPGARVEYRDG